MQVIKVRRVGNSNVISLPARLEALGFRAGTAAAIEPQADGSLRVVAIPDLQEHIAALARRTVAENRTALDILEEHDRSGDRARRRRVSTR